MKAIDILTCAESVCRILGRNDIDPKDVRYIDLFRDWVRMKMEGHKYQYIVYYLSTEYDVSETSVYRIVKRLEKDIEF